jgi:DNA gyrase subunit A
VQAIKASKDPKTALENLKTGFQFTEKQATAILEMRLQRLTGLEREKIEAELKELMARIEWLKMVLGSSKEIDEIIKKELIEIKAKYGDERRSRIEMSDEEIQDEDLIADEEVVVTLTQTGYIKRIALEEYRTQKRGGKGLKGMETREEDQVSSIFTASTKTTLLVFTDKGRLYFCKVHRLPAGNRTSKGKAIANVVQLKNEEKVLALLPVETFHPNYYVVIMTRNGVIKKTSLEAFSNQRVNGLWAINIDDDDTVVDAKLSDGHSDIFVATKDGMSIRFPESEVRPIGRQGRGVRGVTLGKGDKVVSLEVIPKDCKETILVVTEGGYGKRSEISEFRVQGRGGIGLITQKTTDKVGNVVGARIVRNTDEVMLTTDKGQIIRMVISEISIIGRNTQGVRLINIAEKEENVTGFALIPLESIDVSTPETPLKH